MNILPIHLLTETDQPIFGANVFNLARLQRTNFPVPLGVAVAQPDIILITLIKHLKTPEKEVFEQKLAFLKKEITKIPLPEDLDKALEKKKNFYLKGVIYKKKKLLWIKMLEFWLEEIRSHIWKEGFNENLVSNLKVYPIFFLDNFKEEISAYFDPDLGDVVIKSTRRLEPKILLKIDELVMEANKKLFLPQIYQFLLTKEGIKLISLQPFTQTLPTSKKTDIVIPKIEQKRVVKSVVKLFLNLTSGFAVDSNADGILIEGEGSLGMVANEQDFEKTIFRLAEAALSFPHKPVIFKLPDLKEEEIRGTLRLLHQENLLNQAVEVFSFIRNKKNLYNVELAIPFIRSVEEFLQIKRELAVRGVNRKGALGFWLEMAVPENIVNLKEYLEAGLDGVILNLDELQKLLGGYEIAEGEFYKRQIEAIIKFITPAFSLLHQAKIPILTKGNLNLLPEILDFLIEKGVYGIVANNALEVESLPEHLNWAERRMVTKRFQIN